MSLRSWRASNRATRHVARLRAHMCVLGGKALFYDLRGSSLFFFWFSLPIPSVICFCLLWLAAMFVMLGGLYPHWVLLRQTLSLQVQIQCGSVSAVLCVHNVFVRGSISPLLALCGLHLSLWISSGPRLSTWSICPPWVVSSVVEEGESAPLNCGSIQRAAGGKWTPGPLF